VSHRSDALLRLADAMLAAPSVPHPVAVRTAALLGRIGLEHEVGDRVRAALPGAEDGSMRAQLLCLRSVAPALGEDASHLHGALSRACHHHPYELGPSVDELRTLLEGVRGVAAAPGLEPRQHLGSAGESRARRRG
jgi:hypothetical protein